MADVASHAHFVLGAIFYRISFCQTEKMSNDFQWIYINTIFFFLWIQMDIIVIIFRENRTHNINIECKGKSIEISTRSDCNGRIVKSWIELNAWELELNLVGFQ